jgi:hypothetical protein
MGYCATFWLSVSVSISSSVKPSWENIPWVGLMIGLRKLSILEEWTLIMVCI